MVGFDTPFVSSIVWCVERCCKDSFTNRFKVNPQTPVTIVVIEGSPDPESQLAIEWVNLPRRRLLSTPNFHIPTRTSSGWGPKHRGICRESMLYQTTSGLNVETMKLEA